MSKRHERKKAARLARGGKPRWRVEGRELQRKLAAALERVPADHERFVRCSAEIVQQMMAEPSIPVTLQIEERERGELHFVATRHDCPGSASEIAMRSPTRETE